MLCDKPVCRFNKELLPYYRTQLKNNKIKIKRLPKFVNFFLDHLGRGGGQAPLRTLNIAAVHIAIKSVSTHTAN